jgi:hypothetical protein
MKSHNSRWVRMAKWGYDNGNVMQKVAESKV